MILEVHWKQFMFMLNFVFGRIEFYVQKAHILQNRLQIHVQGRIGRK